MVVDSVFDAVLSHSSTENLIKDFPPFLFDSALLYDSVLAATFQSCQSTNNTGVTLFQPFRGSSGYIAVDEACGYSRCLDTSVFSVLNVQIKPLSKYYSEKYEMIIIEVETMENRKWIKHVDAVYSDGTTSPPKRLRLVEVKNNEIMLSVSILLSLLCCSAIMSCWISVKRIRSDKESLRIKHAQPFFLYAILTFAFLTVFIILVRVNLERLDEVSVNDDHYYLGLYCMTLNPVYMLAVVCETYALMCKVSVIHNVGHIFRQ